MEFKAQQQEINDLKQQQNKLKQCTSHRIAFMSSVSHSQNVAVGQTVVFDKSIYDMGGAYDTSTGLFTCSQPGLYHFTVHALETIRGNLDLHLMLNSKSITSLYAADSVEFDTDTMSAVLHLKANDVVKVVPAFTQAELYHDGNIPQENVFLGHLIQSDDCVA